MDSTLEALRYGLAPSVGTCDQTELRTQLPIVALELVEMSAAVFSDSARRFSASALLIAGGRRRFVEQCLIASAINAVGHQAMQSYQAYIEALRR
jgi:hypothetical protein